MNRALNQDQINLLRQLYRFRFGTIPLLTQQLSSTNRQKIHSRLDILTNHGYIKKEYDDSFKLAGKPAIYSLLSESFKTLRTQEGVSQKLLKNIYKDRHATEQFKRHNLRLFAICNRLEVVFGTRLDYFAQSELIEGYDHFPHPMPDGFISLRASDGSRARSKHFFLELIEETKPFFKTVKLINKYLEYDGWDDSILKLPKVLLVCETTALEKRIHKLGGRVENEAPDGLHIYTCAVQRLLAIAKPDDSIWQPLVLLPDQLFSFYGR